MPRRGYADESSINRELYTVKRLIESATGWTFATTSTRRSDGTAHATGRAIDIAARSGPLYGKRSRNICPQYHLSQFLLSKMKRLLPVIFRRTEIVHLILIERDHIHIETTALPSRRRLDLGLFLPSVDNGLCQATGDERIIVIASME